MSKKPETSPRDGAQRHTFRTSEAPATRAAPRKGAVRRVEPGDAPLVQTSAQSARELRADQLAPPAETTESRKE